MYSEAVEAVLSAKGIKPGDSVRLSNGERKFEGTLMQRPDTGGRDILVIKLDNGYNIGIKFRAGSKIEKTKAKPEQKEAAEDLRFKSSLNKIRLIYTGGTIGSKIDYLTGGVYMLTRPEELLQKVPELAGIAEIKVDNLMSIASEDMSYLEWQAIAKATASAFNNGARGVMITHGTDTMHYTSAALSFMLKGIKGPVVITGSQRSPDRGSSDAFINLICGASFAAKSDAAEVGICMHSGSSDDSCSFIRGTHARKMHTSRRDAFKAINNRPIARISPDGTIEYLSEYRKRGPVDSETEAITGFEPKTALVKVHPNSDPEILEYYRSKGYRGIILEATGLGNLPVSTSHKEYNWLKGISEAIDSGIIMGITSQTISGRVSSTVYRNLRLLADTGVVFCEDMMPEVAYVKLGFLLANYKKNEAKRLLATNIAGEISERSEVDWFGE